jgi:hypothetical protein
VADNGVDLARATYSMEGPHMSSVCNDEVVVWMQTETNSDGHDLIEIAARFGRSRERMRDQLRRLVDQGCLTQSAPVTGFADSNPVYTLPAEAAPH